MVVKRKKLPRLVDIMIKPPYQGKHVPITWVLGEEVVVTNFTYCPSQFEDRLDYMAIEIDREGERQWFTTSSSYVIDFFERVSQDILPCRVTFSMIRDEKGHRSYVAS